MKFRTTRKQISEGFHAFSVGYCGCYWLMVGAEPCAYTCGVYGWNADVYTFGNIAIVTGYRPFGRDARKTQIGKLEEEARAIIDDYSTPYEKRLQKVAKLREKFLEELRDIVNGKESA